MAIAFDRKAEGGTLAQDVSLTDEFVERPWSDALRQRCGLALMRRRSVGEEVGHPGECTTVDRLSAPGVLILL